MSYIFISHDLAVVKYMADQVMVMNEGEVVESRRFGRICRNPRHPIRRPCCRRFPKAGAGRPAASLRMSEVLLRAQSLRTVLARHAASRCARWTASISRSGAARPSRSSANRGPGRR